MANVNSSIQYVLFDSADTPLEYEVSTMTLINQRCMELTPGRVKISPALHSGTK